MRKSRFTEEQIIGIRNEAESGATVTELRRHHGITETTFYLILHWFLSLEDAKQEIETWRVDYNQQRPHSSLGRLTSAEYAGLHQPSEEYLAVSSPDLPYRLGHSGVTSVGHPAGWQPERCET